MRGGRHGAAQPIEILRVDTPEHLAAVRPVVPGAPTAADGRAGSGGSRWRWIVPLLAVGLIAAAVLWPSEARHGGSRNATARSATSPAAPPSTAGAAATTAPAAPAALLPAVPDGMLPTAVDRLSGTPEPGVTEVWATPGSSFERGDWFIVQVVPGISAGTGEWRLKINETVVVIGTDRGVRQLSYTLSGRWTVHLWARMTDVDLIQLARQVVIDNGIVTSIGAAAKDHALVARLDAAGSGGDLWGQGPDGVEISYAGETSDEALRVWITPATPDRRELSKFLLTRVARGGPGGRYGYLDGRQRELTLQYEQDGELITIQTDRSLRDAIAVARTLHAPTPGEWDRLVGSAYVRTSSADLFDYVASGRLDDGRPWSITAAANRDFSAVRTVTFLAPSNRTAMSSEYRVSAGQASIVPVADEDATYVLGLAPVSSPGARLDVEVAGTSHSRPVGDGALPGGWFGTAVAFTDPGPWTARLIADDGQVLATLDSGG